MSCTMATTLVLLLPQFLSYTNADTISPTSIINDTEIYNISSSNQYDNVICSKPMCEVICDTHNGCYKINIDGALSDTLDIICSNELSCEGLTISSPAMLSNNIQCTHISSCYDSRFNLYANETSNIKPDISLICNQTMDSASSSSSPCGSAITKIGNAGDVEISCGSNGCYDNSLYINNSASVTFEIGKYGLDSAYISVSGMTSSTGIILNANGYWATNNLQLYCSESSNCTLNCNKDHSCNFMDVYIPNAMFYDGLNITSSSPATTSVKAYCSNNGEYTQIKENSINGRLECQDYDCCPLQFATDIITCTADECKYDCSDSSISCANSVIYAPEATSLTVLCPSNSDCYGTRIHCPNKDNSSCIISCTASNSCQYIAIEAIADYIDTFQLYCGGSDDHQCETAKVVFGFASINTLDLQMHYGYSDNRVSYNYNAPAYIGSFTYNCTEWCDGSDLGLVPSFRESGIIIKDMDIYCKRCGDWDLTILNSFTITCDGSSACHGDMNVELLNSSAQADIYCMNDFWTSPPSTGACSGNFNFIHTSDISYNYNYVRVHCEIESSCAQSTFNFTNIGIAVFNCTGHYSCYKSTIIADTNAYLYMFCNNDFDIIILGESEGWGACESAEVYCPSGFGKSCQIECPAGFNESRAVCQDMSIHATGDYTLDYLTLFCGKDSADCEVNGHNHYESCDFCKDLTIVCDDGSTTGIVYDDDLGDYKCVDSSGDSCCPWTGGSQSDATSTTIQPTGSGGDNGKTTSSDASGGLTILETILIIVVG